MFFRFTSAINTPTTPNGYLISISYSGSYNVGAGETYTSLTNTGGIFEALNNGVLQGNVTIDVTSDLTGETGSVPLNQLAEEAKAIYTVLIRPVGVARTITGTGSGATVIKLNGADRVIIEHSLPNAIEQAVTAAEDSGDLGGVGVLVTGSVTVVGEARSLLRSRR